ncbi:MAG: hypothetical protein N2653_00635, partial [Burkholderiales bacterium]|nr:hypothetical protein [Burkholderiales bacterium]
MRARFASVQVGAALLALVAVIGLASSWMLVSRLNAESANLEAVRRQRNAEVLNRAKQALIGYVAAQAAKTFEDDPGRLPCPEAAAFFGHAEYEGQSSPYCTAGGIPAVGRFPWRTVGTEKLVDASGEPLWYVVASGWAKPSSTAHTVINSNCTTDPTLACYGGQLTVDGAPRAAVALIIAPGPAIAVAADSAAGCAAQNQARSTAGPLDRRNYLECENAHVPADVRFATRGPKASFNDQVIAITAEELLPAIEAAVADRFERVVAPALRRWTFTTLAANKPKGHTSLTVRSTRGISAGDTIGLVLNDGGLGWATVSAVVSETTLALAPNSLGAATAGYDVLLKPRPGYPFAASFPVSSGASYRGVAGITQGLLPTGYATSGTLCTPLPCTPSACAPLGGRCDPMFVVWRDNPVITRVSGGALDSSSHCSAGGVPSRSRP